jgi:hypothetical protein
VVEVVNDLLVLNFRVVVAVEVQVAILISKVAQVVQVLLSSVIKVHKEL